MFGLIGSVKTFSKVLGVDMNVCPYMYGLHFVYIVVMTFIQKRGFWGSKTNSSQVSGSFWPFWPSKWQGFFKARTHFNSIFEN